MRLIAVTFHTSVKLRCHLCLHCALWFAYTDITSTLQFALKTNTAQSHICWHSIWEDSCQQTASTCFIRDSSLVAKVLMCKNPPIQRDQHHSSGSITKRNRAGDRNDPCLTPLQIWNVPDYLHTWPQPPSYQLFNILHILPFTPASNNFSNSTGYSTESKAFCKSYRHIYTWQCCQHSHPSYPTISLKNPKIAT